MTQEYQITLEINNKQVIFTVQCESGKRHDVISLHETLNKALVSTLTERADHSMHAVVVDDIKLSFHYPSDDLADRDAMNAVIAKVADMLPLDSNADAETTTIIGNIVISHE